MTSNQYRLVLRKLADLIVDQNLDGAEALAASLDTDALAYLKEITDHMNAVVTNEYEDREGV